MGRFKTNEERQAKIMKKKQLKKLVKLAKKGEFHERNSTETRNDYQDSTETNGRY